ncbi:MAG: hypothetical protein ACRD21_15090 [Vicinamibacteria bacterium]
MRTILPVLFLITMAVGPFEAFRLLAAIEEILERDSGSVSVGRALLDRREPLRMRIGWISKEKLPRCGDSGGENPYTDGEAQDGYALESEPGGPPHPSTLPE